MKLDIQKLGDDFKAQGLPLAEDVLQLTTSIFFNWLKVEVSAIPIVGPLVLVPLMDSLQKAALDEEDKLDGKIGQ